LFEKKKTKVCRIHPGNAPRITLSILLMSSHTLTTKLSLVIFSIFNRRLKKTTKQNNCDRGLLNSLNSSIFNPISIWQILLKARLTSRSNNSTTFKWQPVQPNRIPYRQRREENTDMVQGK
jgi:hypothetical protein